MARKKRNARHVTVDQIAGFCKYHEEILRYRNMEKRRCFNGNCPETGKCPYLIDKGKITAGV